MNKLVFKLLGSLRCMLANKSSSGKKDLCDEQSMNGTIDMKSYCSKIATRPFFNFSGRILEMGCGDGELLSRLQGKADCALFGVDSSDMAIESARKRVPTANFDISPIDRLPYMDEMFDRIVCVEEIARLSNPQSAIQEAFRVLKTGGLAMFIVRERDHERLGYTEVSDRSSHDQSFSRSDLKHLMLTVGFIIIDESCDDKLLIEVKRPVSYGERSARIRNPSRTPLMRAEAIIKLAKHKADNGEFAEAIDYFEQVVDNYPNDAMAALVAAQGVFANMRDRGRYGQYVSRYYDFGIRNGDRVLDIGSGHIPFPFATDLADISLSDNLVGRAGIPFQGLGHCRVHECDVSKMPFEDKAFDFIYCSHVLEHVIFPDVACRELMRVAKRGYIECPTRGKDQWFGLSEPSNHRWYVEIIEGKLHFTELTKYEKKGMGDTLLRMHVAPESNRERALAALVYLKASLANTMLYWENEFSYSVERIVDRAPKGLEPVLALNMVL
jgi:ubiquinone/menaquinone biosynthesis C-methylase UbiE